MMPSPRGILVQCSFIEMITHNLWEKFGDLTWTLFVFPGLHYDEQHSAAASSTGEDV